MTKNELTHRHSSKYGVLKELSKADYIGNQEIKRLPCDKVFRYTINNEYNTLFDGIEVYVSSSDVIKAEEAISELLKEIKLF